MTVIYVPVKIGSAEQAEALPVGTVARSHGSDGEPTHACLRMANGWWCTDETNDDGTPFLVPHAGMVRDTALVPIEAEEETVEKRKLCQKTPDVLRRYVTGWQHYTAKEQNR